MSDSTGSIDRFVVVTGASTGIGQATALYLAGKGIGVFAGVRREIDANEVRRQGIAHLVPVMLDVTDGDSVEMAASFVATEVRSRGLFGLVNNAGVSMSGVLEYISTDDVRRCFEVNVLGPLTVTRAFLPLLRRGNGRIVNMSSGAGRVAGPLIGPYCASKRALESLSDSLRMELRRAGIAVSIIEPGVVDTPLLPKGNEGMDQVIAELPADAPPHYREAMAKMREQLGGEGKRLPPQAIAQVIHRVLLTRRPKARYVVGADARLLLALNHVLPTPILDSVFCRMFGL